MFKVIVPILFVYARGPSTAYPVYIASAKTVL